MRAMQPSATPTPCTSPSASSRPPIFVVGAPRSGTTMLAAMLGAHSRLAAGPETHFYAKISDDARASAVSDRDWPEAAVDSLAKLRLAEQPVIELMGRDRAGIHRYLSAREPSQAAMLESLVEPFSRERGKARWVEKTPNHILHVEAIRQTFPDAVIIRILRDPRDVGLSTRALPTFSNSAIANMYLYRQWHMSALNFFRDDPSTHTLRFEDLVADPTGELQRLCAAIGEDFEASMLDFATSAGDVASKAEHWKASISGKLDPSRQYAWRRKMAPGTQKVGNLVCAELLDQFGYDAPAAAVRTRTAFNMNRAYIEATEDLLIDDAQRGIRWLPADTLETADRLVADPRYYRYRHPLKRVRIWWTRRSDRRRLRALKRGSAENQTEPPVAP